MIYAYGICEPAVDVPAPRRRGLGGATLRTLERGGLAAIYSRHRSLRPRPVPELVLDHERVVEAIMTRGVVLPLRFGTQLEHEAQLDALLVERREELLRSLARVRGKVEMGIRMLPEQPGATGTDAESTGRSYLLARVREHRRYQEVSREMHTCLVALAASTYIREPRTPLSGFAVSYLVDSEQVDAFRQRADELALHQAGMQVLVTGPWPPYSFVSGGNG